MFYWLFKKYMKRFSKDFELTFQERFDRTKDTRMSPDWYWMQRLMFEDDRERKVESAFND